MVFKDPSKVLAAIQACDHVERIRSDNRAKVNKMFNGAPLLSEQDAQKLRLRINANLGEAPVLGQQGRRQYGQAFFSRQRYFKVNIPDAPPEKAASWSAFITRKINNILKGSLSYFEMHRSQWASVLLHGIAPKIRWDKHCWRPSYVALKDFRVPTNTQCSLENLSWFAVRRRYTEGELARKVFGPNADANWVKPQIQELLDHYHDKTSEQTSEVSWMNSPEEMYELVKQNSGYFSSDAVPTIPLWHFYYLDDSDLSKKRWKLCVVPDARVPAANSGAQEFLYKPKIVAEKLSHLIHIQFGDLNNDAPFLYHSVRALGFLLMEPIFHSNLLQCRFLQHVHEHMNAWLRVNDPAARARAQKIELYDQGIVPDGVTIVPQTERHQINPQIVELGLGQTEKLKQQASVSYTQDSEAVRQGEETATGVMARVNAVNALISGLLQTAFIYETFDYKEICRRFCIRNSQDDDVKDFQKACKDFGIPVTYLNSDLWEVEAEVPIGSGNPTMEMAMVQQLLGIRPMMDPTAQQEVLHEAIITFTGDPRKADRWAPIDRQRGVTDGQEHAELAFSTLMLGVPVRQREGLSLMEQIETLIGLTAGVVSRIEQTGNMATIAEVSGLRNVEQYTMSLIQQLSQNKSETPRVKEYSDALGKLMNTVKAFEQRLAEAQPGQEKETLGFNYKDAPPSVQRQIEKLYGFLPATETDAQTDPKTVKAMHSMAIKDTQHQQRMAQDDQKFHMEQRRADTATLLEAEREKVKTIAEIEAQKAKAAAEPKAEPATNGA